MTQTILCIVTLSILSFPVYTAELGRLFVTEGERLKINSMRKNELYEDRIKKSESNNEKEKSVDALVKNSAEKKLEPENNLVTMNGFIRRENGDVTVWMNGAVGSTGLLKEIKIQKRLDRKNQVVLTSKKEMKRLKAGQKWNYKTGEIYDSY